MRFPSSFSAKEPLRVIVVNSPSNQVKDLATGAEEIEQEQPVRLKVRHVMIENIDKVLDRGERLELLVDKTAGIQNKAFRFRKQTREFRSAVWWRNVKLIALLIVLILIVIYVVLAIVCHGMTLPSCR